MSEQRKPVLTGGCQCGAVRYALFAKPERAGICHCRMCQKAVGGPFFAWAAVNVQDFAWTRGAPASSRSSSAADRGFCARCGTPLTFRYLRGPEHIDVTIGSLDTPEAVTPTWWMGIESRWAGSTRCSCGCPRTGPVRSPARGPDAHHDLSASGP